MTRMRFYLFVVVRTSSRPMAVTRGGMAEFFNSPTVAHVCAVLRRWEILALSSDSHQTTRRWADSGPVLGGVGEGVGGRKPVGRETAATYTWGSLIWLPGCDQGQGHCGDEYSDPRNWTTKFSRIPGRIGPVFWEKRMGAKRRRIEATLKAKAAVRAFHQT